MVWPTDDQQAFATPRPHRLPERDIMLGDALHHHWYLQKERELVRAEVERHEES